MTSISDYPCSTHLDSRLPLPPLLRRSRWVEALSLSSASQWLWESTTPRHTGGGGPRRSQSLLSFPPSVVLSSVCRWTQARFFNSSPLYSLDISSCLYVSHLIRHFPMFHLGYTARHYLRLYTPCLHSYLLYRILFLT
jgi:hypothetical protein